MTVAGTAYRSGKPRATELLLGHCALLADPQRRPTARARLAALLGRDLTRLLLGSLAPRERCGRAARQAGPGRSSPRVRT